MFSEAGLLHDEDLVADPNDPLARPVDARGPRRSVRARVRHLPLFHADRLVFLSEHNLPVAARLGLPMERVASLPTRSTACASRRRTVAARRPARRSGTGPASRRARSASSSVR